MSQDLILESFGARRGGVTLSDPLSLRLTPGTVLGVVGPNGVGKSSLLGAIAGTGVTRYGSMSFQSNNLIKMRARERARLLSFLPQDLRAPDELSALELVEVGAHASGSAKARERALHALESLGVASLADRRVGTLSGGQRQLVQFARVVAQDTPIIVLDEPTSALDLFHQGIIARTMRELGSQGKIVIAAVHDLNLALNSCTEVLLLGREGASHTGVPAEVLTPDRVHDAYGVHTHVHTTETGRNFIAPVEHS